jgi:hypothetical protein
LVDILYQCPQLKCYTKFIRKIIGGITLTLRSQ